MRAACRACTKASECYDDRVSDTPPTVPVSRGPRTSRGQALKGLVTWSVLIAVFLTTYLLVGGGSEGTWKVAGVFCLLVVVLFVVFVARAARQVRRFNVENSAAVAAIGRGELAVARETFWRWAEETHVARIAAIARHNLASTLARQGELAQAIEVATDNNQTHLESLQASALAPTAAVDLALYHALANNLDAARHWIAVADTRKSLVALPSVPASRAFAQAVVDCRSGNAVEAARALDERWNEYEALLTGDIVRLLRVVRAFARATAGPREAGTAEMDLISVRPAFPREYGALASGWPEMAAFLAAHGLAG